MNTVGREPTGSRARSSLPVGDLPFPGPLTSDLDTPASALAIGAHPDDIEFGCGATLAKWAAKGCRVHHVVLTDGSKGTWDPSADLSRLVKDRADECRAAARIIDGHRPDPTTPEDRLTFLGRSDGDLVNGVDERRQVARIIRLVRPAVVLGHDPWRRYRLHPDHRAAGWITTDALVAARDPHFFPELGLAPHRPDALLLWEADQPNHVEDTAEFWTVKVDALLCHRSQFESTMGIGPDARPGPEGEAATAPFAGRVQSQLADHGRLAGLPSGEAFHLMNDL
jgi:LmbE family N-acetylglucosaminyl deacetylase